MSVVWLSEVPLLRQPGERRYMGSILILVVPHVIAGSVALLAGPIQFSNRVRVRYPIFHRLLGRTYVTCVFLAAPLGIVLAYHRHDIRAIHFVAATVVQSCTWMITTGAAFVTAWKGHYQRHREWMVRSYAVTFTFVATRVLQPFPAWNRHSEAGFAIEVIVITSLAVLVPDIAFSCAELSSDKKSLGRNIG